MNFLNTTVNIYLNSKENTYSYILQFNAKPKFRNHLKRHIITKEHYTTQKYISIVQ